MLVLARCKSKGFSDQVSRAVLPMEWTSFGFLVHLSIFFSSVRLFPWCGWGQTDAEPPSWQGAGWQTGWGGNSHPCPVLSLHMGLPREREGRGCTPPGCWVMLAPKAEPSACHQPGRPRLSQGVGLSCLEPNFCTKAQSNRGFFSGNTQGEQSSPEARCRLPFPSSSPPACRCC